MLSGISHLHDLVKEGWNHLHLQRPLAAWATWQRALRLDPGNAEVTDALERLANAGDLPAASRAVYRFQAPKSPEKREAWDQHLRETGNLDDLDAALQAFQSLIEVDATDVDAWLNCVLCLAWIGRNPEAIKALERVVPLLASSDPARAADSWALGEVLRLGAGAETLADDFRYSWTLPWADGLGSIGEFVNRWPNLFPAAIPRIPDTEQIAQTKVFEWLDRPAWASSSPTPRRADVLPRIVAAVIQMPRSLRVSSPDPTSLALIEHDPKYHEVVRLLALARREKTPLSLARADAGLATFKLPPGLDQEARAELSRSVVETYYETHWIHLPRQGLDGKSPLDASRAGGRGDTVARAKLAGVIRFREQLGTRPNVTAVYHGYPFDRLRRRLGLIESNENPGSLDPADVTCMSEAELDGLELPNLDDATLVEAFQSAVAFQDDARLVRFAKVLAGRSLENAGVDLRSVFAPLVRSAMKADDPDVALEWIDRAIALRTDSEVRRTFMTWSAEVLARTGKPEAALRAYQALLADSSPAALASVARDGAETLRDNGHDAEADALIALTSPHANRESTPNES